LWQAGLKCILFALSASQSGLFELGGESDIITGQQGTECFVSWIWALINIKYSSL
jgi:hypothetical protein